MIELHDVTYRYPNGLLALEQVSLNIPEGQFVGLIGPNGSGKSTLARHLNGLLLPASGEVLVDGLSTARDLPAIRQKVGMVFQNPESQLVAPLVEDDVAFGPENLALPREEIRERVERALQAVGLEKARYAEPALLSGGQKQRLAIAGVLASRPRYLVLDEPTTMLDPRARREVLDTLRELRATLGLSVILVTHRLEELEGADRLLVLEEGRVTHDGAPGEVWPLLPYQPPARELARRLGLAQASDEASLREALQGRSFTAPPQPAREGAALVAAEHISHRYLKGTPFAATGLEDVSLTVNQGECLGLVGTTGSGKTTLALHLNGLLKPQRGRLRVQGAVGVLELRRLVGLSMQFPEHQLFEETVVAEVEFGPRNFGLPADVEGALAQVGLQKLERTRSPLELSGGEKRLLALASVLSSRPSVLVLDEPTAGLDGAARAQLLERMQAWKAEGLTLVVISHDVEELAVLADRVAVLQEGRLAALGSLRELVAQGLVPAPLAGRVMPGALTVEEILGAI